MLKLPPRFSAPQPGQLDRNLGNPEQSQLPENCNSTQQETRPEMIADSPNSEDWEDYFQEEPGSIPGTLWIEQDAAPPEMEVINYTRAHFSRGAIQLPTECHASIQQEGVTWIDVRGFGNEAILRQIADVFRLHPLTLEDIVNVPQRPKVEFDGDRVLIILRMVSPRADGKGFLNEQVSLLLGDGYVLTIQEEPESDAFGPVRDRLRTDRGLIRRMGADYLACALIDAIVDAFYPALDAYSDRIEDLEQEVLFQPSRRTLRNIYTLERQMLSLRRWLAPQTNAISTLLRDEASPLGQEVRVYLQECYEHATDVLDVVMLYQELTVNLMDLYMSSVSNRMNEIMKVLAVVSTIFIPLTFIAGVYGMNFNPEKSPWNMPELNWQWGYVACWGLMGVVAGGLIIYFWKQGWFKRSI